MLSGINQTLQTNKIPNVHEQRATPQKARRLHMYRPQALPTILYWRTHATLKTSTTRTECTCREPPSAREGRHCQHRSTMKRRGPSLAKHTPSLSRRRVHAAGAAALHSAVKEKQSEASLFFAIRSDVKPKGRTVDTVMICDNNALLPAGR
jgi:hypothetical protein